MDAGAGLGIAGGIIGAIAGGQRNNSTQDYNKVLLPESQYEKQGGQVAGQQLTDFQSLINAGPGQQDVQGGTDASRSLAAMLQSFSQGGFTPNAQDYGYAHNMTNSVFAPQQQNLLQMFHDQGVAGNRAAAKMGRAGNDPILMNKLAQEQTRQQSSLDAQKTSYFAQRADQMPQQRLGYAQQYAQVSQGLASQALANRQALFSMGSQLRQNEQSFRAGTAGTQVSSGSGGGLAGALTGALAGVGAGMKTASAYNSAQGDGG